MKLSQKERVKIYLSERNKMTAWEAIQGLCAYPRASGPPITRLSAIVHTLRHEEGWVIESADVESPGGERVAEYRLIKMPTDPWYTNRQVNPNQKLF